MYNRVFVLVLFCFFSAIGRASPITYEFQLEWISGELAGSSSVGRFTFDSTWVRQGEAVAPVDLFESFDLTIRDRHISEAIVKTGFLRFDDSSNIRSMFFGTNCIIEFGALSSCSASAGNREDFLFGYIAGRQQLTVIGDGWNASGNAEFSTAVSYLRLVPEADKDIPEPSVILLIFTVLGIMIARTKFRSSTRLIA